MITAPRTRASTPDHPRTRLGDARTWLALAALIVVAEVAGLLGVRFTERAPGGWYDQLDKPSFNPPSAVFAPAWTTMYVLIAVAAWRVWRLADSRSGTSRSCSGPVSSC